jgi:hypothetical protein
VHQNHGVTPELLNYNTLVTVVTAFGHLAYTPKKNVHLAYSEQIDGSPNNLWIGYKANNKPGNE